MISSYFNAPGPLHMRVASKIATQINSDDVIVVNHANKKFASSDDAMALLLLAVKFNDLLEFQNICISHDELNRIFS